MYDSIILEIKDGTTVYGAAYFSMDAYTPRIISMVNKMIDSFNHDQNPKSDLEKHELAIDLLEKPVPGYLLMNGMNGKNRSLWVRIINNLSKRNGKC